MIGRSEMSDTIITVPDAVEERVFSEPWQAQAFAIAMQLSKRGVFTWSEWVEVFSAEIRAHPAEPGEDSSAAYYRQWLVALETILTTRGHSTAAEISGVQDLWRRAYVNTPHGLPVVLENASLGCGADDEHHDDGHDDDGHDDDGHGHHVRAVREPVVVSRARSG
jgi:nitrile hydratase accessory protein